MKKLVFAFFILSGVSFIGNAQTSPAASASHVTTAKTGRPATKETGKMHTNVTKSMSPANASSTTAAATEKSSVKTNSPVKKHGISHKRKAHRKLTRKASPTKKPKENKK